MGLGRGGGHGASIRLFSGTESTEGGRART